MRRGGKKSANYSARAEAIDMVVALDLSGRIALICGAGGGGIGAAASRMLAEAGADIVAVDRDQELVDATLAVVRGMGQRGFGIVADLRDPAQCARVVPEARRLAGRIDLLANIAGGMQAKQWGPVHGTPETDYREVMALNVDYVFAICRDAAALMIEQGGGGAIVNISSISALPSAPYHAPYGAAKAAVIALSRSMAVELGQFGIRVNVIAPGRTDTERTRKLRGDATESHATAPLGRRVTSEEVAASIRFLLSDHASGITGQVLTVDAGLTAQCMMGGLEVFEGRRSW